MLQVTNHIHITIPIIVFNGRLQIQRLSYTTKGHRYGIADTACTAIRVNLCSDTQFRVITCSTLYNLILNEIGQELIKRVKFSTWAHSLMHSIAR